VKSLFLTALLILAVASAGCGDNVEHASVDSKAATTATTAGDDHAHAADDAAMWRGTVVETMDAGGYTYVLLDTENGQQWLAGPATPTAVGDKIATAKGMEMRNFTSNAMDRTFDVIWFVGALEKDDGHTHDAEPTAAANPHGGAMGGMGAMSADASQHTTTDQAGVEGVAKAAGGLTIAEVHAQSAGLTDRTIKVRGRVVKFSQNIMGTNWIHIQDGSGSEGTHDLTVTTDAVVQVGDLVLVEGPVSVDRNFGAGYRYPVIVEGAQITVE
jgi:hypothetical protein